LGDHWLRSKLFSVAQRLSGRAAGMLFRNDRPAWNTRYLMKVSKHTPTGADKTPGGTKKTPRLPWRIARFCPLFLLEGELLLS